MNDMMTAMPSYIVDHMLYHQTLRSVVMTIHISTTHLAKHGSVIIVLIRLFPNVIGVNHSGLERIV